MSALQTSRYELKYLITEAQANAIRPYVVARLAADEHSGAGSIGYRVRSLYLDSRHLACYHQTQSGEKNRFKLRIRFYDEDPNSPAFLEIKRRVTNVIRKHRATVSRESAKQILRGASPNASMLLKNNARERDALERFCRLRDRLGAAGSVFVDYYRQAFESVGGNHYRVTFDRHVRGADYEPGSGLVMPVRSLMSEIDGVVLEMKFIDQPAGWMVDVARRFGLQSQSVPKYVECVDVVQAAPQSNLGRTQTMMTPQPGAN
jgi:hypothetical protein